MNPVDTKSTSPNVDDIVMQARERLRRLYDAVRDGEAQPAAFDEVQMLIEAIPLATAEFGKAICRLRNACRYYRDNECGAAAYELALAERSLPRRA